MDKVTAEHFHDFGSLDFLVDLDYLGYILHGSYILDVGRMHSQYKYTHILKGLVS